MKKLNVGEWVAVGIAVILCSTVFMLSAFFSEDVEVEATPELDPNGASGTFPEGEVPSDIAPEDAAAM